MKKWKLGWILNLATLASAVVAIALVIKTPAPVSQPIPLGVAIAKAEAFQQKIQELEQPRQVGQAPTEVHLNSEEVSAALAQASGALPATASSGLPTTVPASADAPFAAGQPVVNDYQVSFEGDVARGQFVTQIAGKNVYVTLAGHLGSKDGFATFDPTQFKVGELDIPISLVNGALQKKLDEQRDRLKLPDDVAAIKVENGELVMTGK
jgi:hypothetical protein